MPFFEFFEPPNMREPALPRDILARDVANMSKAELKEFYQRNKGQRDNIPMDEAEMREFFKESQELRELEIQLSARREYKEVLLSQLTTRSEIIAELSHLSPSELKSIVQNEISIAKKLNDYSNLDAKYLDVAAKMSKGEIKYTRTESVEMREQGEYREVITQAEMVESIVLEAKVVTKSEYDRIVAEGGEFVITQDGISIRKDINTGTMQNAENYILEVAELNMDKVDWTITGEEQIIDDRFEVVCETEHGDNNSMKVTDLIYGETYKIAWHDNGHPNEKYDFNSRQSHYNLKYTKTINGKRVTIFNHLNYK